MFTHLHVHSHYSLLDGLPKIPALVSRAKDLGMTALALTDHGSLYGAIEFYKECRAQDIKPIIGTEAYVAPQKLQFKRPRVDDKNYHLTLLAKNKTGYKNLITLTTIAHLDGFYYKPRIDRDTLFKFSDGVICLSGCQSGEVRQLLQQGKYEEAKAVVVAYREKFGPDYYLEIQNLESSDDKFNKIQADSFKLLQRLSREAGVPLVATHDIHYINRQDAEAQDVLVSTRLGQTINDERRFSMLKTDLSFLDAKTIRQKFAEVEAAVDNTTKIAETVDIELQLGQWYVPEFKVPQSISPDKYLSQIAETGLLDKLGRINGETKDRLEYELDIILKKGFSTYFLVVADFVNHARKQKIITTTRGSAAGSLVSFAIGITELNPLDYRLPFERFLNPERPKAPDIDVDLADTDRDKVIDYVTEKYGLDRVARITTFGKLLPRAAVRDVTRVLGLPYTTGDRIAKMIPFGMQGFPVTIDIAKMRNPELAAAYANEADVKKILDLAEKIEGCARHSSIHAAGVVVAPSKLTDFTPLQREPGAGDHIITQYDMHACEDVGLLKIDFLGIRNLSILGQAVELVNKTKKKIIDLKRLPLDDKKTFALLASGKTMGVFQMGGSGMTTYLKDLRPNNIFDISAMIALYRPGPMLSIPEYIKRKHNPKLVKYLDPRMTKILDQSFGIITYQDDVLLIAVELAGYSWSAADTLRKAMGKKIPSVMAAQRAKFIRGCTENGMTDKKAEELWQLIEPFAAYGFNKAHAASYAMVSYQTAYMKAHYPAEFMTALLSAESQHTDKVAEAVKECQTLDIEVLPPDVSESFGDFTCVTDKKIRFGLKAVKNLGSDVINTIINERKRNGHYQSLAEFITRVSTSNFNKKSLEALAKSGALDSLGQREQIVHNTERILKFMRSQITKNHKQASLFAASTVQSVLTLNPTAAAAASEKSAWEKETLGLYVSEHPCTQLPLQQTPGLTAFNELARLPANSPLVSAGCIISLKKIFTKKNELMLFATLEDLTATIEVVVFPSILKKTPGLWQEDNLIAIYGKVSERNNEKSIIVEMAEPVQPDNFQTVVAKIKGYTFRPAAKKLNSGQINQTNNSGPQSIIIDIPNLNDRVLTTKLKTLFTSNPGRSPVVLRVGNGQAPKKIVTPFKIKATDSIKHQIKNLLSLHA